MGGKDTGLVVSWRDRRGSGEIEKAHSLVLL